MTQQDVELETAQDGIGWYRLVFGHVSKGWKEIQQEYYAELKKLDTGERWVRLLIQKLWKMARYQWGHRNYGLHRQDNLVSQADADMMNSQIRVFLKSIPKVSFLRIGTFSQVIPGMQPSFGHSDRRRHV
jgi:hypothetical protein